MKGITILRGSRSSHKPPVKYDVIETNKYILIRPKKSKRSVDNLPLIIDDGESLVYTDNSKVKGYKRSKQKQKRIKK